MSWDCPYWNHDICDLNGITCKPGKGQCVLKNRYEIISPKSGTHNNDKNITKKNDQSKN
jgi:hypothetical protein